MFKKIFLVLLSSFAIANLFCQEDSVKYYIDEGIKWHDAGNYDEAVSFYDKANRVKPGFVANYEKSYSLFLAKRYDECIKLCKQIIANFKENPELKNVYVNYGSALDDKGESEEAVKVYDMGMKAYPDFYLLAYNKCLTLFKLGKDAEAESLCWKALELNPLHASSHNMLGIILNTQNKVPALLANITFLLLETKGTRAGEALKRSEQIFTGNVTKNDKGNTTITINSDLLDKKKRSENNFAMVELTMSLMSGLDKDSLYSNETPPERLQRKLDLLISSMRESKKNKGFYWSHYAPFFSAMKEKKFTDVAANLCYYSTGEPDVNKWMAVNNEKVNNFYDWFKNYKWPD